MKMAGLGLGARVGLRARIRLMARVADYTSGLGIIYIPVCTFVSALAVDVLWMCYVWLF